MEFDIYQQKAVTITDGPVLVVAGPGAGKTAVVVERIRYLLEQNKATPDEILAVTFTRKAAEEMQARLSEPSVTICTIHALALQLIREVQPDYEIKDEQFDQLLIDIEKMIDQFSGRWKYILVDEFQDIDQVQHRIINQLAEPYHNLCVIGDPDQSIYDFRGADLTPMVQFIGQRIDLVNQYRSSATIVSAANQLIQYNQQRLEHTITPTQPTGELIQVWSFSSPSQEAHWVIDTIRQLLGGTDLLSSTASGQYTFDDIAVIYRLNTVGNQLEKVMAESGLPYYRIGNDDTPPEFWHPQRETISLLTAHAAKGLEFSVVFIIGAEDGVFPYTQKDDYDIEEERRLFYVAMTRAKARLYITYARKRMVFGQLLERPVSRFVKELPNEYLEYKKPEARPYQPRQETLF